MKNNYIIASVGTLFTITGVNVPDFSAAVKEYDDRRARQESLYTQVRDQLNVSTYSMYFSEQGPKRDFRALYSSIAKSSWFKESYSGKSLGDVSVIEF